MSAHNSNEDAHQFRFLNAPLYEAGSGKVRYAAAMYFHQRGWLSSSTLEIYRALAKDDASDPLVLLRTAGKAMEIANLRQKANPET